MISLFTVFFILIGIVPFTLKRLLRYLHVFQLDEYYSTRFIKWLWENHSFDRRGTMISAVTATLVAYTNYPLVFSGLGALSLFTVAYLEADPRQLAKVSLKSTERAKRIYFTAGTLAVLTEVTLLYFFYNQLAQLWASQILLIQGTPIFLVLASKLLHFDEKKRQQQFVDEAKSILKEVNPYVIGITGSSGKTSTKCALGTLLQVTLAPTFWTPKSINTVMGITREIRTNLKNGTQFAVIEMGAYVPGSIDKLCKLTPPHAAIITGVGHSHLERFGSQDNILKAKSELAQHVPADGRLVCNGDNPGARRIAKENPKAQVYLYGIHQEAGPLDAWISSYSISIKGTEFTLHWKGNTYQGMTPLFGEAALSNVLGAFTMACVLGAQPEFVLGAMRNLRPVDNRLEVRNEGGITYLRDAYNSNPVGFKSALDVLEKLPSKRRILMTPGMIELGTEQAAKNKELAERAGSICDMLVIVGHTNRQAIEEGVTKGGMDPRSIYWCATREEAFKYLNSCVKEGDSILVENDLTDLYVTPKKF